MKLSGVKKVLKEDLAKATKDLPAWVDSLLTPLNEFIEKVGIALQNKLTFEDNFYCKQVQIKLSSGVPIEINAKASYAPNSRVYGLLILNTNGQVVSNYNWSALSSGNVNVTVTFASATESDCTILMLLR